MRLLNCSKGCLWAFLIFAFPLVFFKPHFFVGNHIWITAILGLALLFQSLLIFERVVLKIIPHSRTGQFIMLLVLFFIAEIVVLVFTVKFTQIQFSYNLPFIFVTVLTPLVAALVVWQKVYFFRRPVIIQKER